MVKTRRTPNNYVLVVFDGCCHDSFVAARPRVMRSIGRVERRWSCASWTSPLALQPPDEPVAPRQSPARVCLGIRRRDFVRFNERLGTDGLRFESFVPRLWLPRGVLWVEVPYDASAGIRMDALVLSDFHEYRSCALAPAARAALARGFLMPRRCAANISACAASFMPLRAYALAR